MFIFSPRSWAHFSVLRFDSSICDYLEFRYDRSFIYRLVGIGFVVLVALAVGLILLISDNESQQAAHGTSPSHLVSDPCRAIEAHEIGSHGLIAVRHLCVY